MGATWQPSGGCWTGGSWEQVLRHRQRLGRLGPWAVVGGHPDPALLTGTASILSCRPLKGEPGLGFEEPGENCAPPREQQPPPVLLSPSLQYAGAEALASKVQ